MEFLPWSLKSLGCFKLDSENTYKIHNMDFRVNGDFIILSVYHTRQDVNFDYVKNIHIFKIL